MKSTNKHKCDCRKQAVWLYMPSSTMKNPFFCDDCVPRGCSCNSRPKDGNYESEDPDNWEEPSDDNGRLHPCVEFDYSEDGYEIDEEEPS
jgi:hypothetical protein